MTVYTANFVNLPNTDGVCLASIENNGTAVAKIKSFLVGSRAAGADFAGGYELSLHTTDGITGSAADQVHGTGQPASLAVGLIGTWGTEPVQAGVITYLAVHQRASHRYRYDIEEEPSAPLANGNGISLFAENPSTAFNVGGGLTWKE